MKKMYLTPVTEIANAQPTRLLAASGVTGQLNDNLEIGYGGVDEEGEKDPSANFGHFDDDWDKL